MKKILSAVLCAVLILLLTPSVNAVVGEKFIYEVYDEYVEITGLNTEDRVISVPSEIDSKPVTKIGYRAFANSYVREVVLPESVTEIGAGAFLDCLFLEKVTIPSGVSEIKFQTFRGCTLLREAVIPKSVVKIDAEAFYKCSSLNNIGEFSKDLKEIGESAFLDCHYLEAVSVESENTVFTSKDGVLYTQNGECLYLYPAGKKDKSFEIPSEVKIIGEDAFEFSLIKEIVIPKNVEVLGMNSFHHCPNLETVIFEDGDIEVLDCAFLECLSLKKVVIPSDSIKLHDNVFDMCESMTLYAPKGSKAFEYGRKSGLYYGYIKADGSLSRPMQALKIDWAKWGTIIGGIIIVVGGFFLYIKFGKGKKEEFSRE